MITEANQTESIPGRIRDRVPGEPLRNFLHERFCQALHLKLWAGEKQSDARLKAYRETVYRGESADDNALKPNTRRLCQRKEVAARLSELADYAAKLSGIDSGWALLKLKRLTDDIEGFNLDDYRSPATADGARFFDLSKVPADKLRLLTELSLEEETDLAVGSIEIAPGVVREFDRRTRKIKLKGPAKADMVGPLALMARIAGWEAPKKIAATNGAGEDLSFADVVAEAMALVEAKRAAKATVPA